VQIFANRQRVLQVGQWIVLGVVALFLELGLLKLLYEVLGMPLALASLIAAEVLILARFVVADRFVFGHPRPTWARLARYHGSCAGALAVSWVILNGVASFLAVPYELAFLLGTGASFLWSLLTNFLWVWAQPRPPAESTP
jgi:putative flippase GtrA